MYKKYSLIFPILFVVFTILFVVVFAVGRLEAKRKEQENIHNHEQFYFIKNEFRIIKDNLITIKTKLNRNELDTALSVFSEVEQTLLDIEERSNDLKGDNNIKFKKLLKEYRSNVGRLKDSLERGNSTQCIKIIDNDLLKGK